MSSYGDIFRRCDSQQTEEPPLSSQRILRISRMQGIGSFLLHFTPPVDLLPFRHNGGTRVPQPSTRSFCILYSRALPASSHLPFPHPSLRIISRLARHVFSPRLPLFVVFILFHLLASVYFFSTTHRARPCPFYHPIMSALPFPCPSSHILVPFLPFFRTLVCSNFLC